MISGQAAQVAQMLYVFKVLDSPFVKMGYTDGCPYRRIATGFWSNVHPEACCGKLGWSSLQLLALYTGSKEQEQAVKEAVPPTKGEFWPEEMLEQLLSTLGGLAQPLPLPERPSEPPPVVRRQEKLVCCGGERYPCIRCDKTFRRYHHLVQHRESHGDNRVTCSRCGIRVLRRNLKPHHRVCRA